MEFEQRGADEHAVARRLLAWAKERMLRLWWGTGGLSGFLWTLDVPWYGLVSSQEPRAPASGPGRAPPVQLHHPELAGQPRVSHEVIVNLIAATVTRSGLEVRCEIDRNTYEKGIEVPDEELAAVNLRRDAFHGECKYVIAPSAPLAGSLIS